MIPAPSFFFTAFVVVVMVISIQRTDARLGALNKTRGFKANLTADYDFYDFKIIEHPRLGKLKLRYLKTSDQNYDFTNVAAKGVKDLKKMDDLGDTLIHLGDKFFKHLKRFLSFDCGGGFAHLKHLSDIGMDFSGTPLAFLGDFNLFKILSDFLDGILKKAGVGAYLLPQKICTTDVYDLVDLGKQKGIDACKYMTSLSDIDIWAFGGGIGKKNLCAAFSFETLTVSFAQKNIIPTLNIPVPVRRERELVAASNTTLPIQANERQLDYGASAITAFLKSLKVSFKPKVISLSLLRGLRTPTYTKLWDGNTDPAILNIPGNFRFGGAGEVGFGFGAAGYDIKGTIEFSGAFTFDTDYSGDGLENVLRGELFDMAFLIQGRIVPKFDVFQIFELNFAEVFKGFTADMYAVLSGEDTRIQLGAVVEVDLGGVCKIAPQLEFLCEIFSLDAGIAGSIKAYVSKDGVGLLMDGKGHLKFAPNPLYDWILDLIDYPEGGIVLGAEITAKLGHSSHVCVKLHDLGGGQKFCTPKNYGRGVGTIPGRVADCPSGYTNMGLTCFRGTDDLLAPSMVADCPTGYTNMGLTCFRGTDDISAPSRAADCPSGYTNTGLTCFRGTDDISAPSRAADCPSGYTNMGLTCFRGTDDIYSPSRTPDCPGGFTNMGLTCYRFPFESLGWDRMSCPGGYYRVDARCRKHCPNGYYNNGEFCHRPPSSLGWDSFTCPSGYFKSDITKRCHKNCPDGYDNTGEFCHRPPSSLGWDHFAPCPSGYFKNDITKRCHKNCPDGYSNTGETCHRPPSSLGWDYFKCPIPNGYFKSDITHRCCKNCPAGYTNTGETCHRPPSTLGMDAMSCGSNERKDGPRCYPASGGRCFHGQEEDAGLCYKKCKPGYRGIGPMCWVV